MNINTHTQRNKNPLQRLGKRLGSAIIKTITCRRNGLHPELPARSSGDTNDGSYLTLTLHSSLNEINSPARSSGDTNDGLYLTLSLHSSLNEINSNPNIADGEDKPLAQPKPSFGRLSHNWDSQTEFNSYIKTQIEEPFADESPLSATNSKYSTSTEGLFPIDKRKAYPFETKSSITDDEYHFGTTDAEPVQSKQDDDNNFKKASIAVNKMVDLYLEKRPAIAKWMQNKEQELEQQNREALNNISENKFDDFPSKYTASSSQTSEHQQTQSASDENLQGITQKFKSVFAEYKKSNEEKQSTHIAKQKNSIAKWMQNKEQELEQQNRGALNNISENEFDDFPFQYTTHSSQTSEHHASSVNIPENNIDTLPDDFDIEGILQKTSGLYKQSRPQEATQTTSFQLPTEGLFPIDERKAYPFETKSSITDDESHFGTTDAELVQSKQDDDLDLLIKRKELRPIKTTASITDDESQSLKSSSSLLSASSDNSRAPFHWWDNFLIKNTHLNNSSSSNFGTTDAEPVQSSPEDSTQQYSTKRRNLISNSKSAPMKKQGNKKTAHSLQNTYQKITTLINLQDETLPVENRDFHKYLRDHNINDELDEELLNYSYQLNTKPSDVQQGVKWQEQEARWKREAERVEEFWGVSIWEGEPVSPKGEVPTNEEQKRLDAYTQLKENFTFGTEPEGVSRLPKSSSSPLSASSNNSRTPSACWWDNSSIATTHLNNSSSASSNNSPTLIPYSQPSLSSNATNSKPNLDTKTDAASVQYMPVHWGGNVIGKIIRVELDDLYLVKERKALRAIKTTASITDDESPFPKV